MSRQPGVGSDFGIWGTVLNDYLSVSHNADGTFKTPVPLIFTASGGTGRIVQKTSVSTAASGSFNVVSLEPANATDPRPNAHFHTGYNMSAGPTLGPEKAGEPVISFGLESYFEGSGGESAIRFCETYVQYFNSAGVGPIRPWISRINRATDAIDTVFRGDPIRIVGQSAAEIARFTGSGFVNIGSTAIGAVGSLMFEGVSQSPRSCRILFGTDDGGWELRFGKRNGGSSTDFWSLKDNGHWVPVTANVFDVGASASFCRKGYFTDLRFGTRTAIGAETVTGYITIEDAGGTSRKLAVVS